jgi:hypothetical protein
MFPGRMIDRYIIARMALYSVPTWQTTYCEFD